MQGWQYGKWSNISANKISLPQGQSYSEREYIKNYGS